MAKYVINGSFLTEPIMGVQRYAYEILTRLDKMLDPSSLDVEILVPDEAIPVEERKSSVFQSIKVVHLGTSGGKKWDQHVYAQYLRKNHAKGISLCNTVPLFAKTTIVCVHDIVFKTNPEFFTEKGAWHEILYRKLLYWKAFHTAEHVVTCSEFSKRQIKKNYHLKNPDITVITNAWQHYDVNDVDEEFLERLNDDRIEKGNYYFFLSSLAKNKNLHWILENAKKHPKTTYVLAGSFLGDDSGIEKLKNVIYVGRVGDAEARALYKYCKGFLFPSLYEGFGIPPMEALCMGASIIISDIPVLKEIYGDSAHYINPKNADINLDQLVEEPVAPAWNILEQYSWENSAKRLLSVLYSLKS
jgi:glycosyltransferase involved in cell wall biosynthesis